MLGACQQEFPTHGKSNSRSLIIEETVHNHAPFLLRSSKYENETEHEKENHSYLKQVWSDLSSQESEPPIIPDSLDAPNQSNLQDDVAPFIDKERIEDPQPSIMAENTRLVLAKNPVKNNPSVTEVARAINLVLDYSDKMLSRLYKQRIYRRRMIYDSLPKKSQTAGDTREKTISEEQWS